jgi:periodic tryptophan protein 2
VFQKQHICDGVKECLIVHSSVQVGSIEGRHDLEAGRRATDRVTAQTLSGGVYFTCLCYTADGQGILAGGRSKFVCLYNVSQQVLLKKFQISRNLSFDGMQRFLSGQRMTEAGPLDLISEDEEDEETGADIKLPGVRRGDLSSRKTRPEIRIKSIQFSPTGQSWAAVSTEGLLVYTLDTGLVFDPYDLSQEVTPDGIVEAIADRKFSAALVMSLRLNDVEFITRAVESVPISDVQLIVQNFPTVYVEKFLDFLADKIDNSPHTEFYMQWCTQLLEQHGSLLKKRSMPLMASIKNLQRSVGQKLIDLGRITDHNTYMLRYAISQARHCTM